MGRYAQVVLFSTHQGQTFQNRFFYDHGSSLNFAKVDALGNVFSSQIIPFIQNIVHTDTTFTRVLTTELDGMALSDRSLPTGIMGNRGGQCLPPFTVWAFRLDRSFAGRRSGRKAFGALSEQDITDGVAVVGVIPFLDQMATELTQNISTTEGDFTPVLLQFDAAGLPTGLAQVVTSASYVRVSTQNSRKGF